MYSTNHISNIFLLLSISNLLSYASSTSCSPDHIKCKGTNRCINKNYICDGDNDCHNNYDEEFCTNWGCSNRKEASCRSGYSLNCIPLIEYCRKSTRCGGNVDIRVCKMINNGLLERLSEVVMQPTTTTEEIPTTTVPYNTTPEVTSLEKSEKRGRMLLNTLSFTMAHPDCPMLYTRIGDHCLSLFYVLKVGWGEAKAFCETINGELVTFSENPEEFIVFTKHLQNFGLTADFWIGGRYVNDTEGWSWLRGDTMELGSPFWAVRYTNSCQEREEETGDLAVAYWSNGTACYHYQQAPRPNTTDLCAAVTFRHYYYMTDEDCMTKKSPLCLANENLTRVTPGQ